MQPKTWTWPENEKAGLGPGPWQDEHDKEQWQDEATGLPCLIVRSQLGSWCGYVGVPTHHINSRATLDHDNYCVHGGVSFCAPCQHTDQIPDEHRICHDRDDGDPPVEWIGFDCGHAGDIVPRLLLRFPGFSFPGPLPDVYRDVRYVKGEVYKLALQVAQALGDGV